MFRNPLIARQRFGVATEAKNKERMVKQVNKAKGTIALCMQKTLLLLLLLPLRWFEGTNFGRALVLEDNRGRGTERNREKGKRQKHTISVRSFIECRNKR